MAEYAPMAVVATTFQKMGNLRQVVDAHQGFIGMQELWKCLETGSLEWRWIESVTMQSIRAELGRANP